MKEMRGYPLPLGVTEKNDCMNFSIAVESGKTCALLLYKKGAAEPELRAELPESEAIGEVRFTALPKSKVKGREYCYEIDGEKVVDPYVRVLNNKSGSEPRGYIVFDDYDWEGDLPLRIPYHEVVAYSLHVRGFTRHSSSKVKKKGTFLGIIEKIPYLKELGINQIQCMPIYEFKENKKYANYWGYGDAFCFAPKNSYAGGNDSARELKDMVKACHKNGIEVVLNLPFSEKITPQMIETCLQYYVMQYHIDGFILNPVLAPMQGICADPLLKKTKILYLKDDFQNVMRRFLKGDEGMVEGVIWWLRKLTREVGSCNYITQHTGFTMADLVSYDVKHNEANGEDNQDGPDRNFSWNCGVEGSTRKKSILALRKKQMRNAFFLLLMAQGTPCILAGDEFANTQGGNNNVYCQDNETSWLNWNKLDKEKDLMAFVKRLIALRKEHAIVHPEKPLLGRDETSCGVPDVSYHGESAWEVPDYMASRQLGVYYHGDTDCFMAYNMHWVGHKFALPALPKGKIWYRVLSTGDETVMQEAVIEENQKETIVEGRTIVMFVGKENGKSKKQNRS